MCPRPTGLVTALTQTVSVMSLQCTDGVVVCYTACAGVCNIRPVHAVFNGKHCSCTHEHGGVRTWEFGFADLSSHVCMAILDSMTLQRTVRTCRLTDREEVSDSFSRHVENRTKKYFVLLRFLVPPPNVGVTWRSYCVAVKLYIFRLVTKPRVLLTKPLIPDSEK